MMSDATPPEKSDALGRLLDALHARHGDAIAGIVLYGSCLRSGDLEDGVVDFYVVTDRYRDFYTRRLRALANALLPPNVFYLEVAGQTTLRAKYAVVSVNTLARGVSARAFHSYFWGRFAQPAEVVFARNPETKKRIAQALHQATDTFLCRVLPRIPVTGSVESLWVSGLRLSYATELRAETAGRAAELVKAATEFYQARTCEFADAHPARLMIESDGETYRSRYPRWRRRWAYPEWMLRRGAGKILSVLRLLKALFTFDGGLDYIAWKLERHSGQRVEIPERVRRYPLIFIWGLFWRLRRRGVFR